MQFDMRVLGKSDRYRILGGCVTPRPIAWVTSMSSDGAGNAAPFSFFNALGDDPPTVALGIVAHPDGRFKDTAHNIRDTGEFVINLVDEASAAVMNDTSSDAPAEIDEALAYGVETLPSLCVAPPRIARSPVSFECRSLHFIETGMHQAAIVAEVLMAHIDNAYLVGDRLAIDVPAMRLVSRLHGRGWYGRQTDMFEMLRHPWDGPQTAARSPS